MVLNLEQTRRKKKDAGKGLNGQFRKNSKRGSREGPNDTQIPITNQLFAQGANQSRHETAIHKMRSYPPRKTVRSLRRSHVTPKRGQIASYGTKGPGLEGKGRARSTRQTTDTPKLVGKDELIRDAISDIVASLHEVEKDRSDFLNFFQQHFLANPNIDLRTFGHRTQAPFKEPRFSYPVDEAHLKNLRVVSADAGVVTKEYMGMNISLISVALVDMWYKNNEIFLVDYFPNSDGKAHYSIHVQNTQQTTQVNQSLVSVKRAYLEITTVLEYLKLNSKKPPGLIILDGSVRIEPLQKLYNMDAAYTDLYRKLLHAYKALYDFCLEKNILLVGCVKNTSSIEFRENINRAFPTFLKKYPELNIFHKVRYRELFQDFNDTYFLFRLLDINERSCTMELKKRELTRHEFGRIEEDLKAYPLYCYYLQNMGFDMPLKIEFLYAPTLYRKDYNPVNSQETHESYVANKIAEFILPLSNKIPDSSLPIPQIEAHMRATLTHQDFAMIEQEIKRQYYLKLFNRFNGQEKPAAQQDLAELNQKKQFMKEFLGIFSSNRKSSPFR